MSLAGQRADPSRYQVIPRTLIFAQRDNHILLQQVAPDRGAWAGLWNGVGGHVDPGESPLRAAEREFFEETGLTLHDARLAGIVLVDVGTAPGIGVFVFVGEAQPGEVRPNHEGALDWFTPKQAGQVPTVDDVPVLLERALAVVSGAPAFTALTTFDEDGAGLLRFDPAS